MGGGGGDVDKLLSRKYLKRIPGKMGEQEYEFEILERRRRRKSIFIRGIRTVGRGIKEEIKELVGKAMGLAIYIKRVRAIGRGLVVDLESMENKREIMKNKKCLKGLGIWIEDDRTDRKIEIQNWLELIKEEERGYGIEAKLGYQKVEIQGVWYKWDEKKGGLEEQRWNFREKEED